MDRERERRAAAVVRAWLDRIVAIYDTRTDGLTVGQWAHALSPHVQPGVSAWIAVLMHARREIAALLELMEYRFDDDDKGETDDQS